MGKKKNKNKKKKVSAKKEKYAKFRRDKPSTLDITMPDLTDEQKRQRQIDEQKISRYLRFNRNPRSKEINPRREKSKRAKLRG